MPGAARDADGGLVDDGADARGTIAGLGLFLPEPATRCGVGIDREIGLQVQLAEEVQRGEGREERREATIDGVRIISATAFGQSDLDGLAFAADFQQAPP